MATPDHAPSGRGYDTAREQLAPAAVTIIAQSPANFAVRSLIYFNAANDYWTETAADVSQSVVVPSLRILRDWGPGTPCNRFGT